MSSSVKSTPGYKKANCVHCSREFLYPKHLDPRPIYCEQHDPATFQKVDLSQLSEVDVDSQIHVDSQIYAEDKTYLNPTQAIESIFLTLKDQRKLALATKRYCDENKLPCPDNIKHLLGEEINGSIISNLTPEQIINPTGNGFANSPKLKSAAQIRAEYMNRIEQVQCPQITPIELPVPKIGTSVGIWHVGDVHIGTDACTYSAFKSVLDYVENHDDEYIAFQGDLVDFLTGVSVGIMAEQSMTIQDQLTLVTDDLLPLAKKRKILFMLRGNHEDRLDKATRNIVDAMQTVARHLDVQYLQTEGWTKITCAGSSYLGYNIHGFNSGRTPGSLLNSMRNQLLRFPSADVITCGHNHCAGIVDITTEELDDTLRPRVRTRYGVYTSTFHSYQGYARDAGFTAGPLGCARIEFNVEHNTLSPRMIPIVRRNGEYHAVLPTS